MKSLFFLFALLSTAHTLPTEPSCIAFVPINIFLNLPYEQFKSAIVLGDSVECYTNGNSRCIGVFVQVPCAL